jgi:type I restriction-modification system DNA methylase subunit
MTPTSEKIKQFVKDNFKIIVTIVAFLVTMYVQHLTNTSRINKLEEQCVALEVQIANQYDRIDAIKLDKAVFEATITQFTSIQADLREMRADIKELLKTQR